MQEEELYRSLVENPDLAAYWLDCEGIFRYVSPAAIRLFGYAADEVLGQGFARFTYPEDVAYAQTVFRQVLAGQTVPLELRAWNKSGAAVWVRIAASQFFSQGQLAGVVGFITDISDVKQAEQALQAASELHRQVFASSSEGLAILDRDLRYVEWNPAFEKMAHRPVSEAKGKHPWDLFPILLKYGIPEKLRTVLEGQHVELPALPCVKGEEWITLEYHPLRDTQGGIIGVIVNVRDITERKRVEDALRESEDRYRDLCENSQDLLCTHSLEGALLWVNAAAARIMGYEPQEMVGLRMPDLLDPKFRGLFSEYLERIQRDKVATGLMSLRTRQGQHRVWEYHNSLRMEGTSAPVVRGMAHDVTERVIAERELRKSEARFRVALVNSPISVFNQDLDLRYTWLHNPVLAWSERGWLGKTDAEILGAQEASELTSIKRRVLETRVGSRKHVEVAFGGRTHFFDLTLEPVIDSSGKITGITGAGMDVTELQEKTEQLKALTRKLTREKQYLERELQGEHNFEEIVGESTILRHVLGEVEMVASTDSTVLILGETGTGKELVARAIHHKSRRGKNSFIKLNCSAIPTGLLESELFGHEKGAFTGAVSQKVGRLELADQGTLFLDEIGDIPLELQPKLLRVLQDQEFERLGSTKTIRVDVRLVAATNRDLAESVEQKLFRRDLFYRLNVFPVRLPPLRERRDDIPILVSHFVREFSRRMNKEIESIPEETMAALVEWSWPGNVRELENFIERSVILSEGPSLHAPLAELESVPESRTDRLEEVGRDHIIRVLRECDGVISGPNGAAVRLGLKRTTLQSKMQRYGITRRDYGESLTG